MRVLGKPIEGLTAPSWASEVAALLADGVAEEAHAFMRVRALDGQIAEVAAAIADLESHRDAASGEASNAGRELVLVQQAPPGAAHKRLVPMVAAAAVVGVVLVFVFQAVGFLAALIIVGSAWGIGNSAKQREAAEQAARLQAAASSQAQAVARLSEFTQTLEHASAKKKSLEEQRDGEVPERSLTAVGRVYLPLTTVEVAGYPLVIDRSGAAARVALRLPDLAANAQVVKRVQQAVERARAMPMLLSTSGDTPCEMGTLQGEERELQGALEQFSEMLEGIPVMEEQLPLLPKDSGIVRQVEAAKGASVEMKSDGVVLRANSAEDDKAVARISDLASRMRSIGKNVDEVLRSAHRDLSDVLDAYRGLRSEALDQLHASLHEVLFRSDLAHVTYYCPKCNRVPKYLFHRLGIDIEAAHLLEPQGLLQALQEDEETRQRIVSDERILADISDALGAFRELEASVAGWVARMQANAQAVGADLNSMRGFDAQLRAMRAQQTQALEQFRAALRKAVTGNARPLLDLSKQARLYLDPDGGLWTCGVCNTVFDDPEVARMGRMLKVKDELLMPMWNHLWTEKDDFRKSELFRTNEQIQRLMEKETVALREVSEQYRADMRPVRENLILSTTEAKTKQEQLGSTVDSLAAMGVVSKKEAEDKVAEIASMTGGNLEQLKVRAEAKETLLNQEPQAQMNRRIPAIDPVSVLLTPETLFRQEALGVDVVQLPASGDGR